MGSITEEVYRLRYVVQGQEKVRQLQSELGKTNRLIEQAGAKYRAGRMDAIHYVEVMAILEKRAKSTNAALRELENRKGPRPGALGGGGRSGGSGMAAAAGVRTLFAGANIAQDFAQGGAASTVNNLVNPMLWDDLAKAVPAAGGALKRFGPIGIAVGATLLTINEGLEAVSLGWSSLPSIVGNTKPFVEVSSALDDIGLGLGKIADDTGISSVASAAKDLAGSALDAALGWTDAADAVKATAAELEKANATAAKFAENAKRFGDSGPGAERGKAFGDEIGALGGIGAMAAKMGGGNAQFNMDTLNRAVDGDAKAQALVSTMLGNAGVDTAGLKNIMAGGTTGAGEFGAQPGDAMVGGREKYLEQRQAAERAAEEKRREDDRKIREATGGVLGLDAKLEENIFRGLEENLGVEGALGRTAGALDAKLRELGLDPDLAARGAREAVDRQWFGMRDEAVSQEIRDPGGLDRRLASLHAEQMGMGMAGNESMFGRGPSTVGAGSFAQSVQDSQKPMVEQQKRANELLEKIEETNREILKAERNKRVLRG